MASGLAIIASRRTTLDDYLSDGQEGKLVPPEDASALRAAIQEFLAAPELVVNMGQWARKKAELFTTKNFAQQLTLIFKELAAK
jgi:glycosyltransferase involved in cell wall biosynthesis